MNQYEKLSPCKSQPLARNQDQFRAKGIKVISLHITLNVVMVLVYSGFNTFINFPVFSVLLDPFYKIPFFFHTSGLEYPTRGDIQHLLVLTRKPGIKICKYNFLGELMVWAFEHQGLQSPPSLSDALSVARPKVVDVVPVLVTLQEICSYMTFFRRSW